MPTDAGSHSGATGAKCFEVPQLSLKPGEGTVSSAAACLRVGIKTIAGIQNEDVLTDLFFNYL